MSAQLLTAEDVAALLAVPVSWVYAETRAGRLPHVPLGRYRRYRHEAIEAWVTDRERGPTAPPTRYRKHAPGSGPGGRGDE